MRVACPPVLSLNAMGSIRFTDDCGDHDDLFSYGGAFLYGNLRTHNHGGTDNGRHDDGVTAVDISNEGGCVDGDLGTRPIPSRDGPCRVLSNGGGDGWFDSRM